jgi:hypothetical protein
MQQTLNEFLAVCSQRNKRVLADLDKKDIMNFWQWALDSSPTRSRRTASNKTMRVHTFLKSNGLVFVGKQGDPGKWQVPAFVEELPEIYALDHPQLLGQLPTTSRTVEVVDDSGKPLQGVTILLVWSNGTHLQNVTGDNGRAIFSPFPSTKEAPSIYCAHERFSHYYGREHDFSRNLVIRMTRSPTGGAVIFAEGTGFVPGLDGRLNPIRDAQDRTYIYAENIAVEGGKPQPVNFATGQPFPVEDVQGHRFQIKIVAIIGRSSLIEYQRLSN